MSRADNVTCAEILARLIYMLCTLSSQYDKNIPLRPGQLRDESHYDRDDSALAINDKDAGDGGLYCLVASSKKTSGPVVPQKTKKV